MIELPADYSKHERTIARHMTFEALGKAKGRQRLWQFSATVLNVAAAMRALNVSLKVVPIRELARFVEEWRAQERKEGKVP